MSAYKRMSRSAALAQGLARGLVPLAALFLAACAGGPETAPMPGDPAFTSSAPVASGGTNTGAIISDVGPPRERARVHTELAAAYYGRGNMAIALEELRIAIAADPGYAPAFNMLGLVHMDLKENGPAQQNFQRALQLAPGDPEVNHNYGWFLCQTQREDESLRFFMAAVRNPLYTAPQKSFALAGECALRRKREAEAIDMFDRALRIDPTFLPAILSLATVRYQRAELAEARDLVARFHRIIDPNAESTWLALRVERKLGNKDAQTRLAEEMRRRFAGTREYEAFIRGQYD